MHFVLFERCPHFEELTALVALELFYVCVVQLSVLPQVTLLAKAQAASLANKRLFSRVSSHVCSKDLSSCKLLLAKLTLEPEDMRELDVPVPQAVGAEPL